MRSKRATLRVLRRRLLARASALAMQVALRPRSWASGLLAVGLIGAHTPALAQETIDLASDADVTIQGAAENNRSGYSVSGAGDVNGDGIDDLIIGTGGTSYLVLGSDQGLPGTVDLATDADVVIQGAGHSVSGAGDINDDGIDDLIIGAPFTYSGIGASYVVFGSDQGFAATIDLATEADVTIQGVQNDRAGASVSGAGDVNGDGIDDLIIGAWGADINGVYDAGASYVVLGSDQGLPATIDLATEADVTIQGIAAFDRAGTSVSGAGDVNGDGIDDLIIGASDAGTSYVVFGSDQGLPATIDLATDADVVIQGGASVSGAGDVNGDGIDDLIIGAGGTSYLVLGNDQGLPATIDLATDADVVIQVAGGPVSGAGDVNGDGIDDLIIGAPLASPNGRDFAGASFVVFGNDQGLPATIDLATDADLIILGAAALDNSGYSVSGAGDVDGDGSDDLIIGAPFADPNGRENAGASYVVFGTPPDPAAAIEDLIAEVEAAGLPHGIENSLTTKLSHALNDVDRGRTRLAIFRLRSFINQVRAQRGKKIDEADADAWIADAQAIIDTLKARRDRHRAPRDQAPSPMVEAQE